MTAWEIVFGWNDGKQTPTKTGKYYVAMHRYDGLLDINTFSFTTEHGWNSVPGDDGKHAVKIPGQFWWIPAVKILVEEATE